MDTTGREKRNTNPKSTLFERLILQTNKREKIRTSLPLSAGHHGRRRRGGERPEGLPEVRIKEGRGLGFSPQRAVSTEEKRDTRFID
jgi:hypothetical protein